MVNVKFGFLADYANQTGDGKVNAIGTFDRIFASEFPALQAHLALVLAFEVRAADAGQTKNIEVRLISEDGQPVAPPLTMSIVVPPPPAPAPVVTFWQAMNLRSVVFPAEGDYEFSVSVDGHQAYSVELHLQTIQGQG
jgi:hypothetical protein